MNADLSPRDRRFITDEFRRIAAIPVNELTEQQAGWLLQLRRNLGLPQTANLEQIQLALISDHLRN